MNGGRRAIGERGRKDDPGHPVHEGGEKTPRAVLLAAPPGSREFLVLPLQDGGVELSIHGASSNLDCIRSALGRQQSLCRPMSSAASTQRRSGQFASVRCKCPMPFE